MVLLMIGTGAAAMGFGVFLVFRRFLCYTDTKAGGLRNDRSSSSADMGQR